MSAKAIHFIPNLLTLCNLLSGCLAVYFAFHHSDTIGGLQGLHWCWIAMGAAAVFDFWDGASARLLKAYSPVGKELDSLSDLVSFGVAPGMMMLGIMQNAGSPSWLCFGALVIPLFGAFRLAKFNIDTTQTTTFRGLPIPANAIFWIGAAAWIQRYGYPGSLLLLAVIVFVSWLMVCPLRMFSLKFHNFDWRENFRRYILIIATVFFLIQWQVAGFVWTIALYVFISLLGRKQAE